MVFTLIVLDLLLEYPFGLNDSQSPNVPRLGFCYNTWAMRKRTSNQTFPFIVIIGGILLLVAALALVWQDNASPTSATSQPGIQQANTASGPFPEIPRTSLEDAKTAFDSATAVFLDVRSVDSYATSHISGSLNIPLAELPERLGELDPANWIVTYCT
jgi:hypothetical protein